MTCLASPSVIVDMFVGKLLLPMSMSMRPLSPLIRVVTVGDGMPPCIWLAAAEAIPPSAVVFWTMVRSA